MSNPHYTKVFDVLPGAIVRSDPIEQEFTLVQQGFDSVDAKDDAQDAELALKAPIASPAFTGTPTAPTPPTGDASTRLATTDFVAQVSFSTNLPGQSGNAGNVLRTNGSSASWAKSPLSLVVVTGTSASAVHGSSYALTNAAATTVTAPPSPVAGDRFGVLVCNGRFDNVINWNGAKHENISDATMTINAAYAALEFEYISASYGWKVK